MEGTHDRATRFPSRHEGPAGEHIITSLPHLKVREVLLDICIKSAAQLHNFGLHHVDSNPPSAPEGERGCGRGTLSLSHLRGEWEGSRDRGEYFRFRNSLSDERRKIDH